MSNPATGGLRTNSPLYVQASLAVQREELYLGFWKREVERSRGDRDEGHEG